LDGHLALVRMLVDGFHTLPIGTTGLGANGLWSVVNWGSELFSGALAVALPGVTALLVTNLAFGVVSRAAPTLSIFSVGLPLSLVLGLVVILVSLPALESSFIRLLAVALDFTRRLSGA
jgi:flagellar biosynthesis protein FliR